MQQFIIEVDKLSGSDLPFHSLLCFVLRNTVSSLNATDKTPMYEMLLIYVFGGWGFGVGLSIFCIGVLGVLSRDQEIRR